MAKTTPRAKAKTAPAPAAADASDETGQAYPATVVGEAYDNKGGNVTCTLILSDGSTRTGRAKHEAEFDPIDLTALQSAAKADAMESAK